MYSVYNRSIFGTWSLSSYLQKMGTRWYKYSYRTPGPHSFRFDGPGVGARGV